jgi:hypothetical protein
MFTTYKQYIISIIYWQLTSSQSFSFDRLHPYHSAIRHLRAATPPAIAGPTVAVAAALALAELVAPMVDDASAVAVAEPKEEPVPLPEIDADNESAWDGHWQ